MQTSSGKPCRRIWVVTFWRRTCALFPSTSHICTSFILAVSLDLAPVLGEIMEAHNSVEKWNKPEKPGFDLNWFLMSQVVRKDPKGVVLIISPFNFPMLLILGPLVSTIHIP